MRLLRSMPWPGRTTGYFGSSNMRLGLLINFGEERLKDGIKRIAN